MKTNYRYYPVAAAQKAWGLYVTCAGRNVVKPGDAFPSPKHPDEYFFTWEKGRVLNEWQFILLEQGEGEVGFAHSRASVSAGSLLVLAPGRWHRFRPNAETGWTSVWVGFGGDLADRLVGNAGFCADGDVIDFSANAAFRQTFSATVSDLFAAADRTPYSAAAYVPMLAAALVEAHNAQSEDSGYADAIFKAQTHIADHLNESIDLTALAKSLGLSYRTFRYLFRKETGVSPLQFQLDRRLARARNLLASTDIPVGEIATSLGFNSPWYFSRFFGKHERQSPAAYRKGHATSSSRHFSPLEAYAE